MCAYTDFIKHNWKWGDRYIKREETLW